MYIVSNHIAFHAHRQNYYSESPPSMKTFMDRGALQTGTRPDKIRIQKWYTVYKVSYILVNVDLLFRFKFAQSLCWALPLPPPVGSHYLGRL